MIAQRVKLRTTPARRSLLRCCVLILTVLQRSCSAMDAVDVNAFFRTPHILAARLTGSGISEDQVQRLCELAPYTNMLDLDTRFNAGRDPRQRLGKRKLAWLCVGSSHCMFACRPSARPRSLPMLRTVHGTGRPASTLYVYKHNKYKVFYG